MCMRRTTAMFAIIAGISMLVLPSATAADHDSVKTLMVPVAVSGDFPTVVMPRLVSTVPAPAPGVQAASAPDGVLAVPSVPGNVTPVQSYLPTPQELLAQLKTTDVQPTPALEISTPEAATMPAESGPPLGTLGALGGISVAAWLSVVVWRRRQERKSTAAA